MKKVASTLILGIEERVSYCKILAEVPILYFQGWQF